MKLSEVKSILKRVSEIGFHLPDGSIVPSHFHVTEVGKITKDFIDCGGTLRSEKVVNFQLWNADDYDHRLHPEKLLSIIELSEKVLKIEDLEVEVEYQGETIGKFGLDFDGHVFQLIIKETDCLARAACAIPEDSAQASVPNPNPSCVPGGGCC